MNINYDTNEYVIRTAMLILYPCPRPVDWFEPTLDQVLETLINLRQLGFQLSAVLFVDIILYIEQYIRNPIGRTLLCAYVILCGKSEQDVIHNFLEILLCPSRELKTVKFLYYLISRLESPLQNCQLITILTNYCWIVYS